VPGVTGYFSSKILTDKGFRPPHNQAGKYRLIAGITIQKQIDNPLKFKEYLHLSSAEY